MLIENSVPPFTSLKIQQYVYGRQNEQMPSAFNTITWEIAVDEFLIHIEATRVVKTYRFYDMQVPQLQGVR